MLIIGLVADAQTAPYFHIGDTIPDMPFTMINYPGPTAKISDFRGKLVILDFWATICASCIDAFPKMMALQSRFADRLVILPVTGWGTKADNEAFFAMRKKKGEPIDLPSVVEADTFFRKFASKGLPFEVWVDTSGKIMAMTDGDEVTSENIEKVLDHQKAHLSLVHRDVHFSMFKPLLVDGNGGPDSAFIGRSMFTRRIDSIMSIGILGLVSDSSGAGVRLFVANRPVLQMYDAVYYKYSQGALDRLEADAYQKLVEIDVKDKDKLRDWRDLKDSVIRMTSDEFQRQYLYCYELILPPGYSMKTAYRWMIDDLDRFFGIRSSIEQRKVKALALVLLSQKKGLKAPASTAYGTAEYDNNYLSMSNYALDGLLQFLFLHTSFPLTVNSTGVNPAVDLHLHIDKGTSLQALNKQLKPYNLALIPTEISISKLVLRDL